MIYNGGFKKCYTSIMNYVSILKEHSLKVTPQRLKILSIVDKTGHIDIDNLFIKITQSFPSISLATLYKNIHIMLESFLISELKIPNMKSKYELTKAPHAHLLCEKCNSFIDFSLNIDKIEEEIANRSHYKLHSNTLIFSGICPTCKNR